MRVQRLASLFYLKTRRKSNLFFRNVILVLMASIGGFLLSLTGLSVGWMIGAMVSLGVLSIKKPAWFKKVMPKKGLNHLWKSVGQVILAIQVGQQMTTSVFSVFQSSWLLITTMLFLSLIVSILSGLFLYWFTNSKIITSLYATTPGGISNMPSIAHDVGANPVVVSLIQAMRIFLVVSIIPLFSLVWKNDSYLSASTTDASVHHRGIVHMVSSSASPSILWTMVLIFSAIGGYYIAKSLKFPSARLVGGIIGVSFIQIVSSYLAGSNILPYFPSGMKIIAQICLGASIGASLKEKCLSE